MPDSGWPLVKLPEVIDFQEGPGILAKDFHDSGVPLIRLGGLESGAALLDGCNFLDPEVVERRWGHFRVSLGDTLLSTSATLGRIAVVDQTAVGAIPYTGIIRMRPRAGWLKPTFIQYLLASRAFQEQVEAMGVGSVIRHFGPMHLRQMTVPVPPLSQQDGIAAVLGTLDDKIDLNRRMNETLEAMARALFKSWFVDFDPARAKATGRAPAGMDAATLALFSEGFEESELGEIPRGWSHRPLYDCAQWVNGAAYRDFQFCGSNQGLPIVKIAELKAGVTAQTKFTLTNPGDKYLIDTGDVLFSWSGNPDTSIDTFVWSRGKAWLNQHIFKVIAGSLSARSFVLWLLRHLRPVFAEIARNKQTTGLGHVTAGDMRRLNVVVPGPEILTAFDERVGPLGDLMLARDLESATLVRLREELLPRLLSGELRVRDAEKAVEQVA